MNNLFTRYLIPTAALLTIASQTAAQNSETLEQGLSNSGTSVSNLLRNARYDFGRGLTFTSKDGANSMTVGGQVQAGYGWADNSDNTVASEFSSNARIRVGGSVMDGKASYFVQMNPSGGGQGNNNLVDAWVGWGLTDSINLRLGQQKMRSGLSADTSAHDTDFETVTRSNATSEFANVRATGVLLEGHGMEGRFNWHFGIANNGTAGYSGTNAVRADSNEDNDIDPGEPGYLDPLGSGQGNDDTDMMVTAGASFGSHGGNSESWSEGDLARTGAMQWIAGATITANNGTVRYGDRPVDADDGNDNTMTLNVFGGMKLGNGLAAQLDIWSRDADAADTTDDGFTVQASYTMAQSGSMQPGFVLRHSSVTLDGGDDATETALGVNAYYAAHNLKTQLQVTSSNAGGVADDDQLSLDLMFTLVF